MQENVLGVSRTLHYDALGGIQASPSIGAAASAARYDHHHDDDPAKVQFRYRVDEYYSTYLTLNMYKYTCRLASARFFIG